MTVPLKGALVIPQKATFEILEKKCVFVVDKTNVVHQRKIGITSKMPGLYVIKSGITGTDRILLDGLRKVKDGDRINYDYKGAEIGPIAFKGVQRVQIEGKRLPDRHAERS